MAELHYPTLSATAVAPVHLPRHSTANIRTPRTKAQTPALLQAPLPTSLSPPRAPHPNLDFLHLVDSFKATGGLAWFGDLECMFTLHSKGTFRDFATSVAQREVIHFEWNSHTWLPLFQFDLIRMRAHAGLASVLAKLNAIYDNHEVAQWFSQDNPWLKGRTPAQEMAANPAAVIDAAAAEVFVVRG